MVNKDIIYNKLKELNDPKGVDTQTLASILGMTRANVSHELNTLWKEGKVYKSSSRPVLFFITDNSPKISKLADMVNDNISLKASIDKMKAAILYPPRGLPTLILGETGVGKSMFASLMYEYAKETGVRGENSPFIVFNCADYYNNPQLLVSQLFGVKKGAYTGADEDKIGLIEKADKGVLFLDEIHRLPPEGQEMLFTFLDKGYFRPLGGSDMKKSDVLIISATTEDPDSALLKTFTRRIPMEIIIPPLRDRTLEERFFLIKSFFKKESLRLNKDISVSLNTMRAFLSYDCPGNVGQLKSDIQIICAKAYSEYLTNVKQDVRIFSGNLPSNIREGLYKEKEHRVLWNKLMGDEIEFFKFSPLADDQNQYDKNDDDTIYKIIDQKLDRLKAQGISDIAIENILEKDIIKYFHKNIGGVPEEVNKKNLRSIIPEDTLDFIDNVISYMASELKREFSSNMYTALALHLNTLIKRVHSNSTMVNPCLDKIESLYPEEFKVAMDSKSVIEKYVHGTISDDEIAYLTIFLLPEEEFRSANKDKVKVILIIHGDTTATSMADVANNLLGENYVIGINAPLDVSPQVVLDNLRELVAKDLNSAGYLLLVDMGSLTSFGETIEREFNVRMKVVSLVSTLHVLEAARKALLGVSLDDIYNEVLLVNSYFETKRVIKEPDNGNKKFVIVTACLTGEGCSMALKSFLKNNLKYDKNIFEIMPLDCLDKNYFIKKLEEINKEKEILFIVSSFPIDMDIKQYSMYDVLSMRVIGELQEMIDVKTTLQKMPMVIQENVSNIDSRGLYNDVISFINNLENKLNIEISDEKLIGLILHLAFLISRLKDEDFSIEYPEKDNFICENVH
jgi:transcriptional regulatory protein LevR/transcriptional regulator with AAA-type ATPase domain